MLIGLSNNNKKQLYIRNLNVNLIAYWKYRRRLKKKCLNQKY